MNSIKNPMHLWFIYLFDQRKDERGCVKCFECGGLMHEDHYKEMSSCYSHILSKKLFPQFKGEEWNVKICHPECHSVYSIRPTKAVKQYEEYLKLKQEKL